MRSYVLLLNMLFDVGGEALPSLPGRRFGCQGDPQLKTKRLSSLSLLIFGLETFLSPKKPILTSKQTILSLFLSVLDLYFDFEQKNQLCMAKLLL